MTFLANTWCHHYNNQFNFDDINNYERYPTLVLIIQIYILSPPTADSQVAAQPAVRQNKNWLLICNVITVRRSMTNESWICYAIHVLHCNFWKLNSECWFNFMRAYVEITFLQHEIISWLNLKTQITSWQHEFISWLNLYTQWPKSAW